jgi:peptidyl-prolyl cis-trans isomerase-like 4
MAVLLTTSAGPLVVDLLTEESPLTCKNFLKLCKAGYYIGTIFWNVQANYIAQTGDPTGTGKGGDSVFSIFGCGEEDRRYMFPSGFADEINKYRKINRAGFLCMAHAKGATNANRSQFFITLRGQDLNHLEGKHTVFGEIMEGHDVLEKINKLYVDQDGRPFEDFRIKRIDILHDPFEDVPGFSVLREYTDAMYVPKEEAVKKRIAYQGDDELLTEERKAKERQMASQGACDDQDDVDLTLKRKVAQSRAIVLEMTGDLPDADVKPPEEALFICKLNPVTNDEDLELIFSRFGKIVQCNIVRDDVTGDSLNYAFIVFTTKESCVTAYKKMNNVLIDDRRIKVDFSQSVKGLWNKHLLQGQNRDRDRGRGRNQRPEKIQRTHR